jgi:hypothetical protein
VIPRGLGSGETFATLADVVAAKKSNVLKEPVQSGLDGFSDREINGPDPVVGVGLVIVGILIMGIGGAATAHYLFNFGTGIAILGAVLFVAFVTLSTYKQRS